MVISASCATPRAGIGCAPQGLRTAPRRSLLERPSNFNLQPQAKRRETNRALTSNKAARLNSHHEWVWIPVSCGNKYCQFRILRTRRPQAKMLLLLRRQQSESEVHGIEATVAGRRRGEGASADSAEWGVRGQCQFKPCLCIVSFMIGPLR